MNPYQTDENRAYDAAFRRFRESPRVKQAIGELQTQERARQAQIRAFWRSVALGVLAGVAILTLAILAMFAL